MAVDSSPHINGLWLIDSGCSNHYTASKYILGEYSDISHVRILTGNGYITAQGMGTVTLHTALGTRKLFEVMWVPDLAGRHNLLSIPQLIRKGCSVTMHNSSCVIKDKNSYQQFLPGSFNGSGFYVDMAVCPPFAVPQLSPLPEPTAMLGGSEDTQPIEIWHMRLGHLNE